MLSINLSISMLINGKVFYTNPLKSLDGNNNFTLDAVEQLINFFVVMMKQRAICCECQPSLSNDPVNKIQSYNVSTEV